MIFGVDSGGLPLARELTTDQTAAVLSGVGLGGTLGAVLTFALPLSLSLANEASRPYVAKGLVAAVAASPLSLLPVGWMTGMSFSDFFPGADGAFRSFAGDGRPAALFPDRIDSGDGSDRAEVDDHR